MPDDTNIHRTFSIWREFHPSRPLAHRSAKEATVVFRADSPADADTGLYEEIYRWHLREDILAGISEDDARRNVDDALKRLDAKLPPSARHLGLLQDFVDLAREKLNEGKAGPVLRNDTEGAPLDREDDPVQVNSLLALTLHLEWLIACFGDRPGISVSVR